MFSVSASQAACVLCICIIFILPAVSGFGIEAPLAAAGATSFFGWAFNPVGPSPEATASIASCPFIRVPELNGILFPQNIGEEDNGSEQDGDFQPNIAIYCGAKVRPESYAPLAQQILTEMKKSRSGAAVKGEGGSGGVLILQSPFNIYAFKPATVQKVLNIYASIRCIAGHSLGGIWAMEYCQDLYNAGSFPCDENGDGNLSFVHLGVHSSVLSLAQFKEIPFRNVGFTYATQDATLVQAAEKRDESVEEHLARIESEELPRSAKLYKIEGGNHSQYGSYGMPSYAQGLAYKDLEASITSAEQRDIIAKAIVETMYGEKENDEKDQPLTLFGLTMPGFQ